MATAVSQLAEKTPGKESVAIESFARALRQVIINALITFLIVHFSYQQLSQIMLVMTVQN